MGLVIWPSAHASGWGMVLFGSWVQKTLFHLPKPARCLSAHVQTRPDKVRHLLQWCITPLNKALGINVGGVLENSGNSLFNGH